MQHSAQSFRLKQLQPQGAPGICVPRLYGLPIGQPATTSSHAQSGNDSASSKNRRICRNVASNAVAESTPQTYTALNQKTREGSYEANLVKAQLFKRDDTQPKIASVLKAVDTTKMYDVVVVGAGPAGLFLATEICKRGLSTAVIGRDLPIVNNYGVWTDEYEKLGLSHTLDVSFPDTLCYFQEKQPVRVGRGYGRVSRQKLREHLLAISSQAGVDFLDAEVDAIAVDAGGSSNSVKLSTGATMQARMVTLAAGSAGGKFLKYEEGAPSVAAQTAYGIEAEVEGYEQAYSPDLMTFMDFRRHHTGVWESTMQNLEPGKHPNAGEGLWGVQGEVPSFLYALPLGGGRVFVEETCLVAKPPLPFAVLKRRLERRLKAAGIRVKQIHEEEWSYIAVGGPLPVPDQPITAFGAAANLVHPATGFSIARSFREAPTVADELAAALRGGLPVAEASQRVWGALWPQERRTQATFQVFGMELLAGLDLKATDDFFATFFALPPYFWRGFLASQLSATELLGFALLTFFYAPWSIKVALLRHLAQDPAGVYLINSYMRLYGLSGSEADSTGGGDAGAQQAGSSSSSSAGTA